MGCLKLHTTSKNYNFKKVVKGGLFNEEKTCTEKYRFGFNGKEKVNEIYGEGNEYDYGFRMYDPRIGRFFSVDPLSKHFPWWSPYAFAGNMPIVAIDMDGLEVVIPFLPPSSPVLTIPRVTPLSPTTEIGLSPLFAPFPQNITLGQPQSSSKTVDKAEDFDWSKVNPKDEKTWPEFPPQFKGDPKFGEPSRNKPRSRGEKSGYDEEGGEWRPQLPDDHHPKGHWDYKPPGNNTPWKNIDTEGYELHSLPTYDVKLGKGEKQPSGFEKFKKAAGKFLDNLLGVERRKPEG